MNLSGKKILVTGASGFIGSHLVKALSALDATITAVDIRTPEYDVESVEFTKFDICMGMPDLEQSFDVIYHLAAIAAPNACEKDPMKAWSVNVGGTYNILRFASKTKARKLIFPSTALLYGRIPKYLPIDEQHPVSPEGVYALSKRLGEEMCRVFSEGGMNIAILRLFNVFGPRQDPEYLIPTILHQAISLKKVELWSDKPSRDFNYIDNVIDVLMTVGQSDVAGLFNVGYGEEIKISHIASYIASKLGAEIKYLNKDIVGSISLQCNNNKIRETFGWTPLVSFWDGIERTIYEYKQAVESQVKIIDKSI